MRRVFLLLLSASLLSCSDQTPTNPDLNNISTEDVQFTVLSGQDQLGFSGQELLNPIVVKATKPGKTQGIEGLLINFVVTQGGGEMWAGSSITNNKGKAWDWWTLGKCPPAGGKLCKNKVEARWITETGQRVTFGTFRALARPIYPVLFTTNRDGEREVYVMNADETDQRNLTQHSSDDFQPDWSPDGTKIAFASRRDGVPQVYVMNADGTDLRNLTQDPGADGGPRWWPTHP